LPVNWVAAESVAARCGPRTRGLVARRDLPGFAAWLPAAIDVSRRPESVLYRWLSDLLFEQPTVFEVDRHGDVVPLRRPTPLSRDAA
jgi:hypothetical protein